jgi:GTP pyrophosphokinase
MILRACALVKQYAHNYTTPYSDRCDYPGLMVAEILHALRLDANSISIGIMYYAYTYAGLTLEVMQQHFGIELVIAMEKLQQLDTISKNPFKEKNDAIPKDTIYNLRNMLVAIVGDIRIVLIKLAIHTCNMRLMSNKNDAIRQLLAYEAKEIYAPLANRLGVGKLKKELEDLSFSFLQPEAYANVVRLLNEGRIDRETYITEAINQLRDAFAKQQLIVELQGRVKHIFSIWKKMQHKMLNYNELYDIHAVRVLVETITDCYTALGVVHTLWKHIPKEFDDYIACPKSNGYQSLHTTVVGPHGKMLEVQIRTKDMHRMSELGIAAHWRYKEGGKSSSIYDEKINYLRQIIAWQAELTNDLETEEALKVELFEDRIYVFTPKGDIVDLPLGATAIDLAYHIHTDVGHRCRGAKVNGKIIPITQPLATGMQVEILTTKEGGPSRDWLNPHIKYLVTSKARAKIHQWFRHQDREKNIQIGREIMNKEFRRLGITKINLKELATVIIDSNSDEDLLAGLGGGEIRITKVFDALQQLNYVPVFKVKHDYVKTNIQPQATAKNIVVIIDGVEGLKYRLAKCCTPQIGDEIIGYITLGNGVSIHKKNCLNILQNIKTKSNRFLEVSWHKAQQNNYLVHISIKAYDRRELLRDITTILASEDVDIIEVKNIKEDSGQIAKINVCLKMANMHKLSALLFRIQNIANVIDVYRIYPEE